MLSAIYYVVINIVVPLQWPQYDATSQTVSELSAIDAPTRKLWNVLSLPYALLTIAFAFGVLLAAGKNRKLWLPGVLLFSLSMLNSLWPLAPMHRREALADGAASTSDAIHIGLGIATEALFLVILFYTAYAFGKRFRIFSGLVLALILIFGYLTFKVAPDLQSNLPTPFLGIWERINIAVFLFWTVVLAITLLRPKQLKLKSS
jgi:hypothetical protein